MLSVFTVVLGPLWIGKAEANLGIEICTSQGVKTIPAPDDLGNAATDSQDSNSHETLSPCFICTQNDQDDAALVPEQYSINAIQQKAALPFKHDAQYISIARRETNAARAPPTRIL